MENQTGHAVPPYAQFCSVVGCVWCPVGLCRYASNAVEPGPVNEDGSYTVAELFLMLSSSCAFPPNVTLQNLNTAYNQNYNSSAINLAYT